MHTLVVRLSVVCLWCWFFVFLVTGEAEKEVDLEQYFQNPLQLHCTTKFCDDGKAEGAKEYAELQVSFPQTIEYHIMQCKCKCSGVFGIRSLLDYNIIAANT